MNSKITECVIINIYQIYESSQQPIILHYKYIKHIGIWYKILLTYVCEYTYWYLFVTTTSTTFFSIITLACWKKEITRQNVFFRKSRIWFHPKTWIKWWVFFSTRKFVTKQIKMIKGDWSKIQLLTSTETKIIIPLRVYFLLELLNNVTNIEKVSWNGL